MALFIKGVLVLLSLSLLSGCLILPLKQNDPDQALFWCPPLPNCASTEAVTFVHSIQPFDLIMPMEQAWPLVQLSVSELDGTHINQQHEGYIHAKSYSTVFHFLDYFEVLYMAPEQQLNVRSSSLLGIIDLWANYRRTEQFRDLLIERKVIKAKE